MDIEKYSISAETQKALLFMYYGVLWSNEHGKGLNKHKAFKVLKSIKEIKLKHKNDNIDDYFYYCDDDCLL